MGNEIMLGAYGQPGRNKSVMLRATKAERALRQQAREVEASLYFEAATQKLSAMLRKEMAETAIDDIQAVAERATERAGNDPFIAAMVVPVVDEFARQAARDIHVFGNRLVGF